MKLPALGLCLVGCLWAAGCSLPEGKRGAACERSAQCADGLVCIEGVCGTHLRAVAEGSTVPDFGGDDAGAVEASADGSAADAMSAPSLPPPDAAMSTADAAVSLDAATGTGAGDEDGG